MEVPNLREVPRIMGTEAEYVLLANDPRNPNQSIQVDYALRDAFKNTHLKSRGHILSTEGFVDNGDKTYPDVGYAEYCTAELVSPLRVTERELRGAAYVLDISRRVGGYYSDGVRRGTLPVTTVLKRTLGDNNRTAGMHENYLGRRELDMKESYAPVLGAHLASRNIWAGAGGVSRGAEGRFEFVAGAKLSGVEDAFNCNTTSVKPLVNDRDEPLADPRIWRRIHIISGDGNMWPWPIFMKLATTSLVLRLVENAVPTEDLMLDMAHAVKAARSCSLPDLKDPAEIAGRISRARLSLISGEQIDPLELQFRFIERCEKMTQSCFISDEEKLALKEWRAVCEQLAADPLTAHQTVEWIGKLVLGTRWLERQNGSNGKHGINLNTFENMWDNLDPAISPGLKAAARFRDQIKIMKAAECAPQAPTRAMARGVAVRWLIEHADEKWDYSYTTVDWHRLNVYQEYMMSALDPYNSDPQPWLDVLELSQALGRPKPPYGGDEDGELVYADELPLAVLAFLEDID